MSWASDRITTPADERIAALDYEATERGETLAVYSRMFEAWDPEDERWEVLQSIMYLLDFEPARTGDDELADVCADVAELASSACSLVEKGAEASAGDIGAIVRTTEAIKATTLGYLAEMTR